MTITILRLFLMTAWVGLHYVVVAFPDHTHLLKSTAKFGFFLVSTDKLRI